MFVQDFSLIRVDLCSRNLKQRMSHGDGSVYAEQYKFENPNSETF